MSAEPTEPTDDAPNYKIRSFSFYPDDLDRLDRVVDTLKKRGAKHVNRSRVLRIAIACLDNAVDDFDDAEIAKLADIK